MWEETEKLKRHGSLLEENFIPFLREYIAIEIWKIIFKTAIHTHAHRADSILETLKAHLYDLIMSIICSGQFRVRQFGHHPALTLKACWYFVGSCKDVIYIHRLEIHRSFIKSAQSLKMLAQLSWSGLLKMSTCFGTVLVLCRVDMSCTLWNALRLLVDTSKIFIKLTVCKWLWFCTRKVKIGNLIYKTNLFKLLCFCYETKAIFTYIPFLQKSSVFTIRNTYKNLFNMAWIINTVNNSYICSWFFDDLLTVHLSIILGVDQLNAQILVW